MVTICASCKKIKDDRGNWIKDDGDVGAHPDIYATHGICPECAQKLYPEIFMKIQVKKQLNNWRQ